MNGFSVGEPRPQEHGLWECSIFFRGELHTTVHGFFSYDGALEAAQRRVAELKEAAASDSLLPPRQ